MNCSEISIALAKVADELLYEFQSDAPGQLFHYTDTNGLIGIFSGGGELWATDARCMNDTDELSFGKSMIDAAMKARADHPANALMVRLRSHPACSQSFVFVVSFSERGDLLSQWRAYANNGSGFSIGFLPAKLRKLTLNGKSVSIFLARVQYGSDQLKWKSQQLIERFLDILTPLAGETLTDQDDQELATTVGLVFTIFSATVKNFGFREELEHRLILPFTAIPGLPFTEVPRLRREETRQLFMPSCDFRTGKYGLTPFVKLRFPDQTLAQTVTEIMLGPRVPAPADAELTLRALLANTGMKDWSRLHIARAAATYR